MSATPGMASLARALAVHGPTMAALGRAAASRRAAPPLLVAGGRAWSAAELWARARARARSLQRDAHPVVLAEDGAELVVGLLAAGIARRDALPVDTRMHEPPAPGTLASRSGRGRILTLTSGSTRAPRAVRGATSVSALRRLLALHRAVGPRRGDVVLGCTPMHHGHGMQQLAACMLAGATLVDAAHLAPASRIALLRETSATIVSAVPVQLERMLAHARDAHERLPGVRSVVAGSEPLDPATVAHVRAAWGDVLTQAYGTTEAGTVTVATPAMLAVDPTTVGRPLPGVRLAIEQQDAHGVGRVRIRVGRTVHRTDDLGSLHDGLLRLHGRVGTAQPGSTLDR